MPTVDASDSLHSLTESVTVSGNITPSTRTAFGAGYAVAPDLPALSVPAGLDSVYRITSWDITVGDDGVSHMSLTLSTPPPSKPGVPSNLYLMQLLTDLQNQVSALSTSTYGSGRSYATIVIAAVDSRSTNADFVCAGFTDEQTINLAIAALPYMAAQRARVGKIVMLEGVYNLASPIEVPTGTVATFEGMGVPGGGASTITLIQGSNTQTSADDFDLMEVGIAVGGPGNRSAVDISGIAFQTYAKGARSGFEFGCIHSIVDINVHHCWFAGGDHTTPGGPGSFAILGYSSGNIGGGVGLFAPFIHDNQFLDTGIRIWHTDGAMIHHNVFDGTVAPIELFEAVADISITDNFVDGGTGAFAYVEGGDADVTISGNYIDSTGGPGVLLDSCLQATIVGNNLNTYFNQLTDSGNLAGGTSYPPIPMRGNPNILVGAHAVALRWTYGDGIYGGSSPGAFGGGTPITIADNEMSWTDSAISVIHTGKNPSIAAPFSVLNIHGNTAYHSGPNVQRGAPNVPCILLDGGIMGIYASIIADNLISFPLRDYNPADLDDAIVLQNKCSYNLIANNKLDDAATWLAAAHDGTHVAHWGTATTGPYPISIRTPDCVRNFLTGNYCAPGYINDQGTNTAVFGNLVGTDYHLDGGAAIWTSGTGTDSGVQVGGHNQAEGAYAIAEGYGADAYEEGQVAHASTLLTHAGDAQGSEVTAAVITYDATPTALANQAAARLVAFPDGERTVAFEIVIVARQAP